MDFRSCEDTMPDVIDTRPRRYFGFHYILLRCTGLGWWHHPDENDTNNFPGWYLYYSIATQIVWVAGFVGLETIDPFVGEKELDSFMFSLSFVITHNLTIVKLYLFFFRNKEIQDIVRTIEIDLHDYYQNENTNRKTIRICKTFTFAFIFFGWLTIGNSNTYGAIQDIHWKDLVRKSNDSSQIPHRSLAQPIYIPWDYQRDQSYIPTFILELVGLLWTGHIVMGIDTFIGSVILHMSSQFSILKEAIETAYDRTMIKLREGTVFDADENLPSDGTDVCLMNLDENNERIVRASYTKEQIESALQTTLVNCIRQHQVLVGCVEKFSATYSYGFMTQLLSSMAAICVVMVQVSQDASSLKSLRLVTSLAFFAAMIIQLAIQCFTGNELTLQAGRISEAVMQCKWERMTPRLRSLMMLIMMRAQRPLRLSAAGFAHMDNACFLAVKHVNFYTTAPKKECNVFRIMKAAYSYYAVLSQKQV